MGTVYLVYIVEEGTANQVLIAVCDSTDTANSAKNYAETSGNYVSDNGWNVEIRPTKMNTILSRDIFSA